VDSFSAWASCGRDDWEVSAVAVVVVVLDWLAVGAVVHAKTLAVFQGWTKVGAGVESAIVLVVIKGGDVGVGSMGDGRGVLVERCNQSGDDLRRVVGRMLVGGAGSRGPLVATRIEGAVVGVGHCEDSGCGRRATLLVPVTWDCRGY
jgi:hypothetical protein